ncbi:hypothetical protein RJ639_006502 [Escallonia herrerae]|uniref:Uncharacterized protein n=1 Tax=Escallonia herrerae TaxID=1293975 RepID=A0AA88VZY8_9ASTE|nr:hypothetical protein RJ639_006502 [Escallonia herrerae]
MSFTATEDGVDVFLSGYAFRLRILHERSLSLSKRQTGSDPVKRVSSTDKDLFIRGQHSSMINGLRGSYPLYGPVTRLAKRWIAAHLFSSSLAKEAIEFLPLLSDYDWTFSALIVDINGDLTKDDEKGINENFLPSRKAYGEDASNVNPAMFLATSYDKASEVWTRSSPSSSYMKRSMSNVARARLWPSTSSRFLSVFRPSATGGRLASSHIPFFCLLQVEPDRWDSTQFWALPLLKYGDLYHSLRHPEFTTIDKITELGRLAAYARSSSNLLTKLILHDQLDSFRWEISYKKTCECPTFKRIAFMSISRINGLGRLLSHCLYRANRREAYNCAQQQQTDEPSAFQNQCSKPRCF